MAKASATITVSLERDISSVTRYYKLQASTASAPAKPTTLTPSGWTTTEPAYTEGSTNSLYITDRTVFTDGTYSYSDVSLSSSYEAAKAAYNKAVAADNKTGWSVLISIAAISYTANTATLVAHVYKNGVLQSTGFSIQWYKNAEKIIGGTSATLSVTNLNASYTCVVS